MSGARRTVAALCALLGPLLVGAASSPARAAAQIISPGKLSRPHAALEGIRSCTQCHRLRERGAAPGLCLACHEPMASRIEAGLGYHARLDPDCASCHKEHLGVDFALVRFDTTAFQHASSGYTLQGAHARVECRACHTAALVSDPAVRTATQLSLERTFLGLATECASCHREVDPHGEQFKGRPCTACHGADAWEEAPGFDHDEARYRLTGKHVQVECAGCHVSSGAGEASRVRYRPVRFDACTTCHTDPHEGVMQGRCESCHSTAGWLQLDRRRVEGAFDHRVTRFELVGSHTRLDCAACHDARTSSTLAGIRIQYEGGGLTTYPKPVTGSCLSCHVDTHKGVFEASQSGPDCKTCHGEVEWLPAHYGPERHDQTGFELAGAHATVACASCHRTPSDSLTFRVSAAACTDCHVADDPHDGQFEGRACEGCHTVESFRVTSFDHSATRYSLDGAHRDVSCASCHRAEPGARGLPIVRYRPLGTQCVDCHAAAGWGFRG